MKSQTVTEVKVQLELTREEATFLNCVMQNPLEEHESKEQSEMRIAFFNATKLPSKIGFGQ